MKLCRLHSFFLQLFSGLCLSGLILSAPAVAQAINAPEVHFYPEQAWAINAQGTEAYGGGACSIQNEFNNGFVLAFHGSSDWVQELSINLRQKVFVAGQTYNVSLSVPGVAKEALKARAADMSVLAIPLKGKKALYQAMRQSAVLDFTVEGNDFRFYLTGFSGAAKDFERCMAGEAPQKAVETEVREAKAVPTPVPAATPAPTVKEDKELTASDIMIPLPADDVDVATPPVAKVATPVQKSPKAVSSPTIDSSFLPEPVKDKRRTRHTIARGDDDLSKPPEDLLRVNESIAFEQSEVTGVPITEILPENPQPVIRELPVQTTRKIAGVTVDENTGLEEIAAGKLPNKPEIDPAKQRPKRHKRVTEQLAEKIAANPEIAFSGEVPELSAVQSGARARTEDKINKASVAATEDAFKDASVPLPAPPVERKALDIPDKLKEASPLPSSVKPVKTTPPKKTTEASADVKTELARMKHNLEAQLRQIENLQTKLGAE